MLEKICAKAIIPQMTTSVFTSTFSSLVDEAATTINTAVLSVKGFIQLVSLKSSLFL